MELGKPALLPAFGTTLPPVSVEFAERARRKNEDMLQIDNEELLVPNVCVPGILGGALLFAVVFGSMGLLLSGPSWAQLMFQSLGASLGAHGAANMHKAESRFVPRRFLRIAVGAAGGSLCSAVTFGKGELDLAGFITSAMLTSLGALLVALSTDPDHSLGQLLETLLQKPP